MFYLGLVLGVILGCFIIAAVLVALKNFLNEKESPETSTELFKKLNRNLEIDKNPSSFLQ